MIPLDAIYFNNTVYDLLVALAIFIGTWIGIFVFKKIILVELSRLAKKTKTNYDNMAIEFLKSLGWPVYAWASFYFSTWYLNMPYWFDNFMNTFILLIIAYYIVKGMNNIVSFFTDKLVDKRVAKDEHDNAIIELVSKFLKGLVWLIAILFILSNFGFEITTFIAGLGIGGLAIALALQGILTDLFASLSIYLDKPFKVGDFIIIGNDSGVVQKVGIKSTRIKTLQGQELVISNKEITESRVHNYKKMDKRRIVFEFGVVYETPTKKMRKIPKIVAEIFSKVNDADLDRVHFKAFNDFSLDYEVVYFVNTNDYTKYMDIQQNVNLDLKERFEKEKIEMAYPTQTLYVKK